MAFSANLFWDVDPADIDMDKHAAFIVGRVLDYGLMEDWLFIRDYYGIERLKEIALGIRSLERKSLAFIATITQVPQTQFRCYEQLQSKNRHWYF
ncbi:hypothetical protein M2480_001564 [Parabacteroides sp. PFB2-12]|uniref:DUF6922 domain-containing protein n=1 Tax=unclassified Parabacteroides TaxID=2649774 RepID=UPI002474BDF5|nr:MULTISPECIES: hypothetical protein [unclassified Parabacteroides]MDH6342246.1 hypothetical protein [Parabacteroides sp. PM6-13]MDH6390589.1 hypothetical protein [Parabacteroides sp. PFB2-12]